MSNRPQSPVKIEDVISSWEREALAARDNQIFALLGERWQAGFKGMSGLVRSALLYYTPQNWQLPQNDGTIRGVSIDSLVYPYYFSNIQTILPDILPKSLKLVALPLRGDKKGIAAMSTAILEEEAETLKFPQFVRDYALYAKQYGHAIAYVSHSFRSGIMSVDRTLEICDPMSVLVDPLAKSLEESSYVIYKRWRLISDVQSEYDINFEIDATTIGEDFHSDFATLKTDLINTESAPRCVETIVYMRDNSVQRVSDKESGEVPLMDVDTGEVTTTQVQIEVINPETGKRIWREEAKYPSGRTVILINDKKVFDGENPYDHNAIPFVKLDNHRVPGMFYAMPEWLTEGDIPMILNENVSALQRDARTSANKTIVDPNGIEGDVEGITTDPAQVLILKEGYNGNPIRNFQMGGSSINTGQSLQSAIQLGQLITGVTDSSRGLGDPSVTSGKQQQLLADKSSRRNEIFSSQLQDAIEAIGYRMLFNAVQFRDEEETLEIVSNYGEPTEFMIRDFPVDVQYHVKLVAGSGLPQDRSERLKVLNELIDRAAQIHMAYGPKAARIFANLSDIEEIDRFIDALDERAQQQMQIQPQGIAAPQETILNQNS